MRAPKDDILVRPADDPPSLLTLILDVSARSWLCLADHSAQDASSEAIKALRAVTEQLLVFINTFLLLHEGNRISIIFVHPLGVDVVYPLLPEPSTLSPGYESTSEDAALDPKAGRGGVTSHEEIAVRELREAVDIGIRNALSAQQGRAVPEYAQMSVGFAKALCLHNRARRIKAERATVSAGQGGDSSTIDTGPCNGRVLVITPGEDAPSQYVSIMNCIFSAQRMGVPVDSCVLATGNDSTYLQQAAHLTSGVYLRPAINHNIPDILVQYFQTLFLPDRQSRDFLAMPTPDKVDFRASCMETQQIIEDGYTCSVCLSTFHVSVAKGAAMCPVCSARFAVMPRAGRRPAR